MLSLKIHIQIFNSLSCLSLKVLYLMYMHVILEVYFSSILPHHYITSLITISVAANHNLICLTSICCPVLSNTPFLSLYLSVSFSIIPPSIHLTTVCSSFSLAACCPPCSALFHQPLLWLILATNAFVFVCCILHPSILLPSPLTVPPDVSYIAFPFALSLYLTAN